MIPPLTKGQYLVLVAMRDGQECTLWPVMRRYFLRRQVIKPAGDYPPPSDELRTKQPVRPYPVTQVGLDAILAYEAKQAPVLASAKTFAMKPQFAWSAKRGNGQLKGPLS